MTEIYENKVGYKHTPLGFIPKEWKLKELRSISLTVFSNVDKHIIEGEREVFLCNYKDVYYNNYIFSEMTFSRGTVNETEYEKFKVKKGDVIITKDSEDKRDIAISTFVLEDIPDLICGYHLALIRPTQGILDGLFLSFALSSYNVNHYFQKRANGITRFGLDTDTVKSSLIPLPTIFEQKK
ncbi:restriction endonuclease subunit S [Mucilaginibacter antarcticus]